MIVIANSARGDQTVSEAHSEEQPAAGQRCAGGGARALQSVISR